MEILRSLVVVSLFLVLTACGGESDTVPDLGNVLDGQVPIMGPYRAPVVSTRLDGQMGFALPSAPVVIANCSDSSVGHVIYPYTDNFPNVSAGCIVVYLQNMRDIFTNAPMHITNLTIQLGNCETDCVISIDNDNTYTFDNDTFVEYIELTTEVIGDVETGTLMAYMMNMRELSPCDNDFRGNSFVCSVY